MAKKIRNNPNGNETVENWIRMIHTSEINMWMRKHTLKRCGSKCPPYSLIPSDTQCTYCQNCFYGAIDQVKIYKDYYKVGKNKFLKSELEEELDEDK